MRTIHIYSGIPGSGKTTYINNHAEPADIQLHRDDFRAELRVTHNTTEYFPVSSSEEWKLWTEAINAAIASTSFSDIHIDQTTIGTGALQKLYAALNLAPTDRVLVHVFNLPYSTCLYRNNLRDGIARVPEDVMLSMYNNFKQRLITKSAARRINTAIEVVFHNEY